MRLTKEPLSESQEIVRFSSSLSCKGRKMKKDLLVRVLNQSRHFLLINTKFFKKQKQNPQTKPANQTNKT